jgi:N-acetylmuramoyl-L-alanine amidase
LKRRANHIVLLGMALASATLAFGWCSATQAAPGDVPEAAAEKPAESSLPIASDVRIAGDEKQTRFILDLDRKVSLRAFTLADPYRVVIDLPQIAFHLDPGAGTVARGLIKAFRYGMVMPGGSRMVFDLAKPVKIKSATALDPANGQPARMVIELEAVDRTTFVQGLAVENRPELRPGVAGSSVPSPVATTVVASAAPVSATDNRPVVVLDPGHGGIDNGTQAGGESEKGIVLGFGLALRDRLEKLGKYRVVMTRAWRGRGTVRLDPCRCAAQRRGRCPGGDRLHVVRQGVGPRSAAARRSRKQG